MGFHKRVITKGTYGQLSKVHEELEEAEDALEQGQAVMLLIELADIVGACGGVAEKFAITLDDLVAFAKLRSEVAREENAVYDAAALADVRDLVRSLNVTLPENQQ